MLPFARSTPQSPPGRPVRGLTPRSVLAASGATAMAAAGSGSGSGAVSCVSCGARVAPADLFDISYKTVVAHYKRSTGPLPPVPADGETPRAAVVSSSAAGAYVGDEEKENGTADGDSEPLRARTALADMRAQTEAHYREYIPPILRALHPALSYRVCVLVS